jgi:uncharacterized protein
VHQLKITESKTGTIIEIYVKLGSPRFKVTVEGDDIVVHSTEEPVKGKVNREIIKELTKLFQRQVELVSGATSREKRLLVKDIEKDKVKNLLLTA